MSQPTPDQVQALLTYASARLGMTPEQLQKTVQSGNLQSLSDKVGPNLSALAGDRETWEHLLRSPAAQTLLQQLLGGN